MKLTKERLELAQNRLGQAWGFMTDAQREIIAAFPQYQQQFMEVEGLQHIQFGWADDRRPLPVCDDAIFRLDPDAPTEEEPEPTW